MALKSIIPSEYIKTFVFNKLKVGLSRDVFYAKTLVIG